MAPFYFTCGARRGKTGDWCWMHPELKLSDGFRPGSSTFKTQQVQRLIVFKQKFCPRIKWSLQTFEELQKAQFDWLHWALTHPWYKLLTSKSYLKKSVTCAGQKTTWSPELELPGFWEGPDAGPRLNTEPLEKQEGLWPKSSLPTPQSLFCLC